MSVDTPNITLTHYPQQREDIIAQHVLNEMVLYDSEQEEGYSLNESARGIWDLCNGQRTIQDICLELATPLSIDPNLLHNDVLTAIQHLAGRNLIILHEEAISS